MKHLNIETVGWFETLLNNRLLLKGITFAKMYDTFWQKPFYLAVFSIVPSLICPETYRISIVSSISSKDTRKNNGEVQSYYISENHEPIVSPEVWEKVQEVREQRKRDRNIGQDSTMKFQNCYPLSGMLICRA